uniref:Tetratricopeptide repeat domain 31 n=2 Tax=Nothobranchius kadleci TaxID=1051664 RepID=A0A1A8C5V2_NOTKA
MSRKKLAVKGGVPAPRMRENSRLMRTHESFVDLLSGRRSSMNSLTDALAPTFLGLSLLGCLEDDFYSDDDDDVDDDDYTDDDYFHYPVKNHLQPHPQIRQITDEEAHQIEKGLMEEERRKNKTERNKRKKKRKKEKKRLEKESKDNLHKEEGSDLNSSADQEQNALNDHPSESSTCDKLKGVAETSGCNESNITRVTEDADVPRKAEETQKGLVPKETPSSASLVPKETPSSASLVPKETPSSASLDPKETPKKKSRSQKNKSKTVKVQQLEEDKPEVAENPKVQEKKDESNEKKSVDPATEEFAKRSLELAGMGNRLAASGQYEVAVRCFTDAIKYNPTEFKLFGNRSLCYDRLQQHENALRDADLALSMEPNWIKGLFRKGKALCGLKRYYEASLIYANVLKLDSTSSEAALELKRAQTLHLMEMGFSWAQSSEALKAHTTLEDALEALFASDSHSGPEGARAIWDKTSQPVVQEKDPNDDEEEEGEWTVQHTVRSRTQQVKELDSLGQIRSKSHSPTPHSRGSFKPELFPVRVGTLASTTTYTKLHELFSRTGIVYSIKMLLEEQCALVNYTTKEDCERAIQYIDGMVLEGARLSVRYPFKAPAGSSSSDSCQHSSSQKKECFFWRTTGCTRGDCTYRHVPEHKNIDKDKFTSGLGFGSHAGDHK